MQNDTYKPQQIVHAIIVTFNPEENVLVNIVSEIKSQVYKVIIVDNSSNNIDFLREAFRGEKNVELISLNENFGIAYAQNKGIKHAKDNNATHVILFDQDSAISEGFVDGLISCENELLKSGGKVGGVGPAFFDRETGSIYPATVYRGCFIDRVDLVDKPVVATFIIASGSLIRISVLDEVGYMREDFFIDFVDVEWSIRAKKYGYNVYINPLIKMEHSIGDQRIKVFGRMISMHSDFRKYYISRNALYMTRLSYVPFGYKVRVILFNVIRSFVGGFISKNRKSSLNSLYKGWIAGLGHFDAKKIWR